MKSQVIISADKKFLFLILLAALLLRAFFGSVILHNFGDKGFYPHNSEDAEQYWQLAKNLAEHNVFSARTAPPFDNEFVRTPGYPAFISIFYRIIPSAWFTIIFQNLIALANIILIYSLVFLLLKKKIVALTASGIYAVEPAVIYWNNQLLSETLFTFIILSAVYIFIKNIYINKRYFLPTSLVIGALIAFASYTRPIAQFILLVFMLFGLLILKTNFESVRQYLFFLILMVASFFVLSFPWLIRSKTLINTYDFSSASASIGFGKYLRMMYLNRGDNIEYIDRLNINQFKLATIKYIAKHPLTFAEVHLSNLVPLLMGDSYFTVATVIHPPLEKRRVILETWFYSWRGPFDAFFRHRGTEAILFFGGKIILLILNLLAILGSIFWFFILKRNRVIMLFFFLLIYYFILSTGVAAYSRFRQPINPYIFIFVALGIDWLSSRKFLKSRKHSL